MGAWVLIVIFDVYSGSNITFQEFTSKERCYAAWHEVRAMSKSADVRGLKVLWCQEK